MNAFDNEREEHLMHQHPPLRKPSHFSETWQSGNSSHDQKSGAGLTFFRRWNYGLSLQGKVRSILNFAARDSPALIAVDKARYPEKLGEGYIPEPLTS